MNLAHAGKWTALHVAAYHGQLAVIETLVNNRADPALVNNDGWTAYQVAYSRGNTVVAEYLSTLPYPSSTSGSPVLVTYTKP